MTRLSDTQLVILTAAAQRADLSVLPLPDSLTLRGGALKKVMDSLRNKGLIRVIQADGEDQTAAPAAADTGALPAGAEDTADAPAPGSGADDDAARVSKPAKRSKAKATPAKQTEAAPGGDPSGKPTHRAGTKQALMIDMLKPEGATVEQIAAATGWQHHTIRGAISGALKKKLGLIVEATRTREVGPNKTGAKGSATVYRIVE
ncbi:MAG: hypothetical protein K0R41_4564 [Geminicoccaceae bacterium]|nr:hypothetical protein [Geminicoccaceae bacterium]